MKAGTLNKPQSRALALAVCCLILTPIRASKSPESRVAQAAISGTTYYVNSVTGKDDNTGLSPTKAWKTIDKVNKSAFTPGDSILFKRGQTWREQLIVPSSGTPGHPISFGAYGIGAKPIINGGNILTSWSQTAGTTYVKFSVIPEPKIVVYNGARLTKGEGTKLARKSCFYDRIQTALYVNVGENPALHKLEAAVRDYSVRISHHDYVSFANLDIRNTNNAGFYIQDSDHLDLDACDITHIANRGTLVTNVPGSSETSQYLSFRNMNVSRVGGTGISVDGDADATGHVLIQNCVVHDCGWNADPVDAVRWTAGIKVWGGANYGSAGESDDIIIENCEVYNQADTHGDYSGGGIWVDQWGKDVIVRRNRVHHNATYGILLENLNNSALVHNNLVYLNKWGIAVYRNIRDQKIYNNTLFGNSEIGLWCKGGESPGVDYMINNEFKNNIVIGGVRALCAVRGGDNKGHGSGNVYEYNCLGPEKAGFVEWGSGIYYADYKSWEGAYGRITHSVGGDPRFVSTSIPLNFRLRKTSPCLSKGAVVNVFVDLDGNPIPARPGKNPDLGAYESK
jgi:parallel beta-helix repeat protein